MALLVASQPLLRERPAALGWIRQGLASAASWSPTTSYSTCEPCRNQCLKPRRSAHSMCAPRHIQRIQRDSRQELRNSLHSEHWREALLHHVPPQRHSRHNYEIAPATCPVYPSINSELLSLLQQRQPSRAAPPRRGHGAR